MADDTTRAPKSNGVALIPFVLFVVIYLGAGIIYQIQGVENAFYQFPPVVAILIATIVAFIMFNRGSSISDNFATFAKGAGNVDVMTMLMIYLLAGAFSTVASAMGGIDSTVNLGVTLIPAQFIAAGVFVIAAFLSVATGTSMGTVGALVPIALGLADKAGLSIPLVLAACLSGAMFGDNLSMISDTTIASTRTQRVELKDKFRTNFWIALPAAIITVVLLIVFSHPAAAATASAGDFSLVKVLPYILVLVLALTGMDVFTVLIIGILVAGIIGLGYGDLTVLTFASNIYDGFTSMIEVFFLTLFCAGIAELTKRYGGIQWLVDKIGALCKSAKSTQVGIFALTGLVDAATANNTVAIVVTGSIAGTLSEKFHIDPRRTASLMDIASCVVQGFIPYGAQMLLIMSLTNNACGPLAIMAGNWYLMLLAVFAILSIVIPGYSKFVCKGEWDFDAWKPVASEKKAEAQA